MGKLIEFYRPLPHAKALAKPVVEEEDEKYPAVEVLKQLLPIAEKQVSDILIMMRRTDGALAFVSNLPDLAASVLFMEQIKTKAVATGFEEMNGGPTTA